MRAAICLLFALIAHKEGSRAGTHEDFSPTPIPLKEWNHRNKDAAGTLQEIVKTEAPVTVAALPAHYWEDALRHSVYLTLVRDKIDEMIAQGVVVSPDKKPSNEQSKGVDDHDLWEKIKGAPFDRIKEDPSLPGDVAILAKGRLIEENGGFRFAEDEAAQQNCGEQNCTKGVKAFWSVKRVRQRDIEPSTGKYHYELTFSVTSQTPIKPKKPFENPVRTFTVRENPATHPPQVSRQYETFRKPPARPQRAIWVHRNIEPSYNHRFRPTSELDRIFTSFFSDEDHSGDDRTHRFKPNVYTPQSHQYSKIGFAGERELYNHKNIPAFPTNPQSYKFSRPPLPAPPASYMHHHHHHPYTDANHFINNPYLAMNTDMNLMSSFVKTTRPPVLPTPLAPLSFSKQSTMDVPIRTIFNTTELPTKPSEAYNTKSKSTSAKINYSHEHVRPPVYSAPPGVFVTMDKKPFKPMPPLKVVQSSLNFKGKPIDFRPSPQVLEDAHLSEPNPNTAFRPIPGGYPDEPKNSQDSGKKPIKNMRKFNNKKPTKHENSKSSRVTTSAPEIITVKDDSDEFDMEWANILGAMAKTTPMASYKYKTNQNTDTTETIITTTATPITTTQIESKIAEVETTTSTTTSTTTPKPNKRTRPPPKYKLDKYKKHKRITTTTTSSTTTSKPPTSTTEKKTTEDLTPQASSAATGGANSVWEPKSKTTTVKPTTITETIATTTRPTTTTISSTTLSTTTRVDTEKSVETTTPQPKNRNRLRLSTLMYKGTSVKHDKWTAPTYEKTRTTPVFPSKTSVRRKISKFQGYASSTTPRTTSENIENNNETDNSNTTEPNKSSIDNVTQSTELSEKQNEENDKSTKPVHIDEDNDNNERIEEEESESDEGLSKDDDEYIFSTTSPQASIVSNNDDPKVSVTEDQTTISTLDIAKNRTKCKKKKHNNLVGSEETKPTEVPSTTVKATEKVTTPDMFDEMLGGFTMDEDDKEEIKTSSTSPVPDIEPGESKNHERYIVDDDLERFLESLEAKENHETSSDETSDDESGESPFDSDEQDDGESPFDSDEESDVRSSHYDDDYDEDEGGKGSQSYSLLELMAME